MHKPVFTSAVPAPVGPYSPAIRANGFIFASGQIAIDPATQEMVKGGIVEQTEQVLRNIASLLQVAGTSTAMIVRCVVYLTDIADFETMNKAYGKFFADNPPARTTIQAVSLPHGALIEIEATAVDEVVVEPSR
jgi:2-iminobutanoate/2-iminopropanoate deaminase